MIPTRMLTTAASPGVFSLATAIPVEIHGIRRQGSYPDGRDVIGANHGGSATPMMTLRGGTSAGPTALMPNHASIGSSAAQSGTAPPTIHLMKTVIQTLVIMTLVAVTPARAIESRSDAEFPHDQARDLFEQFRTVERWSHQQRIHILQAADACIQTAQTRQAFRACEAREGAERRAHVEEVRARKRALWEQAQTLQRAWMGQARGISREP